MKIWGNEVNDIYTTSDEESHSQITWGTWGSKNYFLEANLFEITPDQMTDNDIYELAVTMRDSWENPKVISNRSINSFVLFNVPTIPVLQNLDSDGDSLNDYMELYSYYTNPFLSDTDNDKYSDSLEISSGTDPNNYTDPIWNNKPETPSQPDGPGLGVINVDYNFSTMCIHPDGDQIYYLWDWGEESFDDWIGPYSSGETINTSHIWDEPGEYEVKVLAKDSKGKMSDWSDPHIINISSSLDFDISGGFGFQIEITNTGSGDINGLNWSYNIDGGLMVFPKDGFGDIALIQPGESEIIKIYVFGFGIGLLSDEPLLSVIVENDEIYEIKTVAAKILGPFVFISN